MPTFLEMCREKGIESRRTFSGKFNVRIPPKLHAKLDMQAAAEGKRLNTVVAEKLAA